MGLSARNLLVKQIEAANDGQPDDFNNWIEQSRVALRLAVGEGDPTLERFDEVGYRPSLSSSGTPQSYFDNARVAGVRKAVEILRAALTEGDVIEASGPRVDVAALHPWISGNAASLWDGGHHRQAVEEAARTIEVQLRAKLGVDGTATQLMDAFSTSKSSGELHRLRFKGFEEGADSWKNAHLGAMYFAKGCMMRIRNLYRHGHDPAMRRLSRRSRR